MIQVRAKVIHGIPISRILVLGRARTGREKVNRSMAKPRLKRRIGLPQMFIPIRFRPPTGASPLAIGAARAVKHAIGLLALSAISAASPRRD